MKKEEINIQVISHNPPRNKFHGTNSPSQLKRLISEDSTIFSLYFIILKDIYEIALADFRC
ncbi:hypothetical protein ACN4EE_04835 [Geminocystis sp. CENA526]|uniref:hypothetical protein n=1 Tax=Geminocystis sp. CENA526 TaxID=1355871 RepID=UPI003D6EA27B